MCLDAVWSSTAGAACLPSMSKMAIALRGLSQKYHLKQSQKLFGKFKNLHASHFRFANVSITVEIVETENPPQLLLDRPARGLRQRLEEILFFQNQSKLKECQMYFILIIIPRIWWYQCHHSWKSWTRNERTGWHLGCVCKRKKGGQWRGII